MHPWLTGLSVVGGIYYFGISGAILGPLVLCAVLVCASVFPSLMPEQHQNAVNEESPSSAQVITPTI